MKSARGTHAWISGLGRHWPGHPHLRSRTAGSPTQQFRLFPLIVSPGNVDSSTVPTVPTHVQEVPSSNQSEPNAADEKNVDQWKSTTSSAAKFILYAVEEYADALPSSDLSLQISALSRKIARCGLPSHIGYSQHSRVPQRTKANKQGIDLLAPRIENLSTLQACSRRRR